MPSELDTTGRSWTFGAEHELSDWSCIKGLPEGYARSPDHTIVNTNGIAAQPNVSVYAYGGEINTPPTPVPMGQFSCLREILRQHPNCTVNHRSNLHIHVRVPGLKDSLTDLKRVQRFIHEQLPDVLSLLEPIPVGNTPAERKRARRRKVSHHTFLTPHRLKHQLGAKTIKEFFEREVPQSKAGQMMWHAQPRVCVNLRQLLQTDTVEFRHFPGTVNAELLLTCVNWCQDFLKAALRGRRLDELWTNDGYCSVAFPTFPAFDEEREVRYQATAAKNGLSPQEIKQNIDLILKGKFNATDSPASYRKAQERAGVVSW